MRHVRGSPAVQAVANLYDRYLRSLQRYPVTTKSLTAASVGAAGDALAQLLERRQRTPTAERLGDPGPQKPFNWRRLVLFATFMGVFSAPVSHYWYLWLSKRFPATNMVAVSKRVACDQLLMAPTIIPATLFFLEYAGRKFVAGENGDGLLRHALQVASEETGRTLLANWTIWPIAQVVNFRFVRNELQVLFANLVGVGWNTFLSLVAAENLQKSHKTLTKAD
ncbi:similar to peroxisomal membrane protein PMP22 [Cyanidioschyzon merolae strain 10D]|jgi:hypothetical protein|uniref:Similar to peroxisomal membrane protein PMP22 n=1 Tax=Cyanidioschyzon merolae (strain NIES-3377 / 10D) TaxID=280699 RepID=M1VF62_CYAM1|nr:similar to peroxisomal membrane protein PMP22 [Cyanidioschyzon merolae strain 10D]BAM81597.1 similar to peroxisomal membrane protein PMP22 [Cyanidioschyzon merolae strain 10D]|eukprot:XP_005537633.1 similar to peroxisomal membrane protein PMP22 [Cyanidioschyzon merolae strain 10D]